MGMISDGVNSSLNLLIGKSADINKLLDRQMSILSNTFYLKNTSKLLHPRLAHWFSLVALDTIGDYQDARGNLSEYPDNTKGIGLKSYATPRELFDDTMVEVLDFSDMICDTIDVANAESDYTTAEVLKHLLVDMVPVVEQIQTLVDIFTVYDEGKSYWLVMDSNIDKYIHLPIAFSSSQK